MFRNGELSAHWLMSQLSSLPCPSQVFNQGGDNENAHLGLKNANLFTFFSCVVEAIEKRKLSNRNKS